MPAAARSAITTTTIVFLCRVLRRHGLAVVTRKPDTRHLVERERSKQVSEVSRTRTSLAGKSILRVLGEARHVRQVHRDCHDGDCQARAREAPDGDHSATLRERHRKEQHAQHQGVGGTHRTEHMQESRPTERDQDRQPDAELAVERKTRQGGGRRHEGDHQLLLDRAVQSVAVKEHGAHRQHASDRRGQRSQPGSTGQLSHGHRCEGRNRGDDRVVDSGEVRAGQRLHRGQQSVRAHRVTETDRGRLDHGRG